jgi:hypothetical protein
MTSTRYKTSDQTIFLGHQTKAATATTATFRVIRYGIDWTTFRSDIILIAISIIFYYISDIKIYSKDKRKENRIKWLERENERWLRYY